MKVYTTGVFDILHRGHLNVLTKAKSFGSYLVVGVQDDNGVMKSKGRFPVLSTEERVQQLEALPFVNEVFSYHDTDQRDNLARIKPGVMVQGDDWEKTSDRTKTIEFLEAHNIRLKLLPYTKDISTTEIRNRILNQVDRHDKDFIVNSVKLLKIADLKIYEEFNEDKTQELVFRIDSSKEFINPITVTKEGLVIDGVNRLEAMRRLGAKYISALVVDYDDVELRANVHFKKPDGSIVRLSEFGDTEGERIEFPLRTKAELLELAEQGKKIPSGETWHIVKNAVIRMPMSLTLLKQDLHPPAFPQVLLGMIKEKKIRFYPRGVFTCDEW